MKTRLKMARLSIASLSIALAWGALPALAQQDAGPFPRLGEHRFSPTGIVRDPWVKSYVVSNLGMSQAMDNPTPPIVIDGDTIPGLAGSLLLANLELEYQQKIVDWFAFRIGYSIHARIGTELETLLSRGVNTVMGFEIGWLARLLESHNNMLSLDVSVSNKNYTTIDILRFVEDVIDGIDASLVQSSPAIRATGGLRYAHEFSNLFGIIANGEVGYGESIARYSGDDEVFYQLGAQLDFDLAAWRNIPLNVAVGLQTDSYPEASPDVTGNINTGYLRIGFIARDDFTIGLTFAGASAPLANDPTRPQSSDSERVSFGAMEFDLRYYF
jgi:hypothetical protein